MTQPLGLVLSDESIVPAADAVASALTTPIASQAIIAALQAIAPALPKAPDGLGPGRIWLQGDAAGGYVFTLTGTST